MQRVEGEMKAHTQRTIFPRSKRGCYWQRKK